MEHTRFILILLITLPNLIYSTILGSQQRNLFDLRRFKTEGVGGRFVLNRDVLEKVLQNRKQQDAVCGQDVRLRLPHSLPHSSYNVSQQGEVALYYLTITDHTLADELPTCLKEQVATIHQHLLVSIPVIIGTSEEHGVVPLHLFTNSTKKVSVPYITSSRDVTYVESIEEGENGTVTLLLDGDVMTIQVQEKVKATDVMKVGKDFDEVNGKVITATNYPLPFDWDCELFGSHVSFCQVLNEVSCELAAVEGDVCALTTSSGERSPASMKIVNMTGIFGDMIPYLAEAVPLESIEAESISREHAAGIRYPCLTS